MTNLNFSKLLVLILLVFATLFSACGDYDANDTWQYDTEKQCITTTDSRYIAFCGDYDTIVHKMAIAYDMPIDQVNEWMKSVFDKGEQVLYQKQAKEEWNAMYREDAIDLVLD